LIETNISGIKQMVGFIGIATGEKIAAQFFFKSLALTVRAFFYAWN